MPTTTPSSLSQSIQKTATKKHFRKKWNSCTHLFPTVVHGSSKVDLRQGDRRRKAENMRYRMKPSGQEINNSQLSGNTVRGLLLPRGLHKRANKNLNFALENRLQIHNISLTFIANIK